MEKFFCYFVSPWPLSFHKYMHVCNMHFSFWDLIKSGSIVVLWLLFYLWQKIYILHKNLYSFLIFMPIDLCSRRSRICVHTHNKHCGYLSNNYFNVYYSSDFQTRYTYYSVFHYWPHSDFRKYYKFDKNK